MAEYLTKTTSDERNLQPGRSMEIRFRPGQPGEITVKSHFVEPRPHKPLPGDPTPPETLAHRVELLRPGDAKPVGTATGREGQRGVLLRYTAASEDLARAGDWVCRVINLSDSDGPFNASVSYVSNIEIHTATFDGGLLNQLLFQLAGTADINIHLESSSSESQKLAYVSWSRAITETLPEDECEFQRLKKSLAEFGLELERDRVRFHLPNPKKLELPGPVDPTLLRLHDLNSYSDFRGLRVEVRPEDTTSDLVLEVSIGFETIGTEISPIDIESLSISVQLSLDGAPRVEVNALATFHTGTKRWDVSGMVRDKIREAIHDKLYEHQVPAKAKDGIAAFITSLMRLGAQVRIHRAQIKDNWIVVSYYHELIPVTPVPITPRIQGQPSAMA